MATFRFFFAAAPGPAAVVAALVAIGRVLRDHPVDDRLQARRHRHAERLERRHRFGRVLHHRRHHVLLEERRPAGEQGEEDAAEAVDVRADVREARVARLFRRDPLRERADRTDDPVIREQLRLSESADPTESGRALGRLEEKQGREISKGRTVS